jgi:hypothetical protein
LGLYCPKLIVVLGLPNDDVFKDCFNPLLEIRPSLTTSKEGQIRLIIPEENNKDLTLGWGGQSDRTNMVNESAFTLTP